MTILTDSELTKIANNHFVLEFVRARLVQQTSTQPRMYEGSGSIVQGASGQLQLKLYCCIEDSEKLFSEFSFPFDRHFLTPGQLLESDYYYSFEGVDFTGQTWTAHDVTIDVETSLEARGQIVHARRLRKIQSERAWTCASKDWALLIVPGTFRVPFTHVQPDTSETGLSACTMKLGDAATATLKTKDGALVVDLTVVNQEPEVYAQRVLEALGIAAGVLLRPQVEVIVAGSQRRQVVRSLDDEAIRRHKLVSPVPTDSPTAFPDFHAFVVDFLAAFNAPYDQLAGYWFRVLSASGNSLENQALILTTAIEGVLKAYFPKETEPDDDYVNQLADARLLVKDLDIGGRARQRLLGSLGNAKDPTAFNALQALGTQGCIPQKLCNVWRNLRNKMSHADELQWDDAKSQAFINDLYGCLELFYRLLMLHIDYKGRMTSFSKVGWPHESVTAFKGIVPSTTASQVVPPNDS